MLWDMKVTAGARFNAASRLASKDRFDNISIAIYSSIVVSTSLTTLVFDLGPILSKGVGVGTLIASIIILVLSMKLFADRHAVESEQMHRCALEINELRRLYSAKCLHNSEDLLAVTDRYNAILQKYSINHTEEDYYKYKYSHPWEFEDLKDVDAARASRKQAQRDLRANLVEKIAALLGGAGLAAALSGLAAALLGL